MRLVHDQPRDPETRQHRPKGPARQPLRRNVDQTQPSAGEIPFRRGALGGPEAGVNPGRGDAARSQAVHLVLHERDEGRHHDRRPLEQEGGQLEAERLAGPGRHDGHQVPAFEDRGGGLLLTRPEPLEAKPFLERLEKRVPPDPVVGQHAVLSRPRFPDDAAYYTAVPIMTVNPAGVRISGGDPAPRPLDYREGRRLHGGCR